MSETKTLKIFEPLKTYFEILCQSGKCDDFSSPECKELIEILTSTYETRKGECFDNYVGALKWFAYELKKADSPISLYTIKGKLKEIFKSSANPEDIVKNVNDAKDLNGFNMSQDTGENSTYENILKSLIDSNKYTTNEQLFDAWINNAFSSYSENKKYFEEEIKPKLEYLDSCQKKILNDYFEVKVKDETSNLSVNEYISRMKTDLNGKEARLNTKIDNGKAKIVNLLPTSVRDAFNKFLVTPPNVQPDFVYRNGCYEFEKSTEVPKEEKYKVPKENVEKILKWFENISRKIKQSQRISTEDIIRMLKQGHIDIETKDKPDSQPYEQDGVKLMFPSDFDVVRYENKWGLGLNGELYKKEDGEFKLYSKDKLKADAESFKEKNGKTTCGNLCIFDKPEECNKFFEKLIKGDELTMKELSDIINNADFATNYSALKTNIAEVNPLFVVGTLKLFGFQKYAQIDSAGRKIIKIESFTNWWNRQNKNGLKVIPNSFGSHNTTEPPAPANVELFFKLLINFINSNEFVLNPRDKKLMTKTGEKPKATQYRPQQEYNTWTDKEGKTHTYKNVLYEGKTTEQEKMSLSDIANLMKNNASFTSNSIGNKMSDNILNLSTLLGLMTHMTATGNFSFLGKAHTSLSGLGYVVGGAGDKDETGDKENQGLRPLPCAAKAFRIYEDGKKALMKNNKTFDEDNKIYEKIEQLGALELNVADDLETLANVVKIVNVLKDNKEEVLNSETIQNLIDKCGKNAEKCAKKSDSIIFSILEKLW